MFVDCNFKMSWNAVSSCQYLSYCNSCLHVKEFRSCPPASPPCHRLRIRLRNTVQDDKRVLNFERCKSGRWCGYLSEFAKKNHKTFCPGR